MHRRRVLRRAGAGLATGLVGTAGCLLPSLEPDRNEPDGNVRPTGEPETIPEALECDDAAFERHAPGYDPDEVTWGDMGDLALRVSDLAFEYGETAHLTLANTSRSAQVTGPRHHYNLEMQTEEGWRDVRGWSDGEPRSYGDEGVRHGAGEGFSWGIPLSEDGIVDVALHDDALAVCPPLASGRYRFAFWGIGGSESALAVAFDLDA